MQAWNSEVGDKLELLPISIGIELLMISFLTTGFFYNQLYVHWLYTTWVLNTLLCRLTQESLLRNGRVSALQARRYTT